ncbi:19_t:CDS:2 [Cetraspora pellucida]|uniref:19_t:CDS:1 n=1 Tax=Cetraspora pellucida TaxID=1433469 RepID=A0A9N9IMS2_9GLOM|nr:19_t:CDS:2 [Cetraspora pellucida]
MAWFYANALYLEARNLTYVDFPIQWVYDKKTTTWKLQQCENMIRRIATLFNFLHTVNAVLYSTFKKAYAVLGLLQNNTKWDMCLAKASQYSNSLTDDILLHIATNPKNTITNIQNQALLHLQSILLRHEKHLNDFPNMPISNLPSDYSYTNRLICEEQSYDINELNRIVQTGVFQLNIDQHNIFEKVIVALENKAPVMFFVDSPDETGKTFLYK